MHITVPKKTRLDKVPTTVYVCLLHTSRSVRLLPDHDGPLCKVQPKPAPGRPSGKGRSRPTKSESRRVICPSHVERSLAGGSSSTLE